MERATPPCSSIMRLMILLVALSLGSATRAHAESELSEHTAVSMSVLSTLGSWTLFVAGATSGHTGGVALGFVGTLLAPTTGHWYAGRVVTWGLATRLVSVGLTAVGMLAVIDELSCHSESCTSEPAVWLVPLGIAGYLAGTIADIYTVPGAVRDHNSRLRDISIVPLAQRGFGGAGVVGRF